MGGKISEPGIFGAILIKNMSRYRPQKRCEIDNRSVTCNRISVIFSANLKARLAVCIASVVVLMMMSKMTQETTGRSLLDRILRRNYLEEDSPFLERPVAHYYDISVRKPTRFVQFFDCSLFWNNQHGVRSGQIWGHTAKQRVATSTLRRSPSGHRPGRR